MAFVIQKNETAILSDGSYKTLLKSKFVGRTVASLVIRNTHATDSLKWRVVVSDDPNGAADSWGILKAEDTLTGNTVTPYAVVGTFCWVSIEIMSNGAGESPAGYCWMMAVGN